VLTLFAGFLKLSVGQGLHDVRDSGAFSEIQLERFDGGFGLFISSVDINFAHLFLIDEVIFRFIRLQSSFITFHVISPSNSALNSVCVFRVKSEVCQRTHLGIYKCVSQDQLFTLKIGMLVGQFVPFRGYWQLLIQLKSLLIGTQLVNESSSNL
jgi:hypothetical protein